MTPTTTRWRTARACLAALLLLILLLPPLMAAAQVNPDITRRCRIGFSGGNARSNFAVDRSYKTAWRGTGKRTYNITITLPNDMAQGGLYLCFQQEPEKLALYAGQADQPFVVQQGESFAHRYIPFEGAGTLRLELTGGEQGVALSELFVLAGQEPPAWVQRWRPTPEAVDMLVLVAHPDDELLWFGGAIPYYALERHMDVVVASMTWGSPLRRSELLNALWVAGVRYYPVLGDFTDRRLSTMKASYQLWGGEEQVAAYVTDMLRQLKPLVVLTHDLQGEYGHPAHIITARALVSALDAASNESAFPQSAARYGTWDVPKAYLHLYPGNPIVMTWQQPIAAYDNSTALEVCQLALKQHRSQLVYFNKPATGRYTCTQFGLYRSLVGPDVQGDDFFENLLRVVR